jgi:hypothetical protein
VWPLARSATRIALLEPQETDGVAEDLVAERDAA